MAVIGFEGIVEAGKVCPPEGMDLAEGAMVYIVVPNMTLNGHETPIEKTSETKKMSADERAARIEEINAAYADYPTEEEAMTRRLMRSKSAKAARREEW